MDIHEFYATFGVQYSGDAESGEIHPLGMTRDNYVVIEAPDLRTAQRMADAIFEQSYAFIYPRSTFIDGGMYERWYADKPLARALTIRWDDKS
jgi:hypothetical protein